MRKKNKVLASSLAIFGTGSLVTSLASSTVRAEELNILGILLNLFRNIIHLGSEEKESNKLDSSAQGGENSESVSLLAQQEVKGSGESHFFAQGEEYKFSDLIFDHNMVFNVDSPEQEGNTIKIGNDVLVATRIGDKDYNLLVWRIKDSEKSGRPIYIFDTETYNKNVVGAIVRAEREKKDIPCCVEYIYNLGRTNYSKKSQQLDVLKQRANGIYKAFELGKRFKVYKLAEKVEDCKPCSLEEYKSSYLVFDHDMILNLGSPEQEGETFRTGDDELVATRIGDKDYNFLVWRVKDSEKIGKPIYIFDVETYSKSVVGAIVRAEKEKKATPSCVEYIYDFNRKNYNKASQLSMLKERANGIYKAFKLGKKVKFFKLVEKKNGLYNQNSEMSGNFGILTES